MPTLTSVLTGERGERALRYDFSVRLIELSTLDEVGSWSTPHAAPLTHRPRHLLASETIPFEPQTASISAEGRKRLAHLLHVAKTTPGSSLRVQGLALRDELPDARIPDACQALATARQTTVERELAAGGAATFLEPAASPACGRASLFGHALVELWSEPTERSLILGLLD